MKPYLLLILLASSLVCAAPDIKDGDDWVHRPSGKFTWPDWTDLPETDIYEVVATKETSALISELADKEFALITEDTARHYTGHYFRCPAGKKPYLVRAVYGQGGTGGYEIYKRGKELLVHHHSLGGATLVNKSALVVNLDFNPVSSYTFLELAK